MFPCAILHDEVEILKQFFQLQMDAFRRSRRDHFPFDAQEGQDVFGKELHHKLEDIILML